MAKFDFNNGSLKEVLDSVKAVKLTKPIDFCECNDIVYSGRDRLKTLVKNKVCEKEDRQKIYTEMKNFSFFYCSTCKKYYWMLDSEFEKRKTSING
ncbi:MAG: hypothetical protein JW791_05150 [Nanoarchaeota archaeon]|nr:hypothetical protein [Nanoarchaeota archaeon]